MIVYMFIFRLFMIIIQWFYYLFKSSMFLIPHSTASWLWPLFSLREHHPSPHAGECITVLGHNRRFLRSCRLHRCVRPVIRRILGLLQPARRSLWRLRLRLRLASLKEDYSCCPSAGFCSFKLSCILVSLCISGDCDYCLRYLVLLCVVLCPIYTSQ